MKSKKKIIPISAFIVVLVICIVVSHYLMKTNIIDFKKIKELRSDIHFNVISMSSIIGGFLFTGLSFIISAIENERVKRLWKYSYLDNLFIVAISGIICDIISIITAFTILVTNLPIDCLIKIEITTIITSIVLFVWNITHVLYIITHLKD